jgi:lipopolysaccharide biosynthesis glycosyltransferase
MYWFACLRTHEHSENFEKMYMVSLATARDTNPYIKPILLLHGFKTPILQKCEALGAQIIPHKSILELGIKSHYPNANVALGTFLRLEIPKVIKSMGIDDEFVLYTDCDVMFLGDVSNIINYCGDYFAVARESRDCVGMNAGVMVLRWRRLLLDFDTFMSFIRNNWHRVLRGPFDQQALSLFYGDRCSALPDIYNWRPYWGFDSDVRVLHFHGPKPLGVVSGQLTSLASGAFDKYCQLFASKLSGLL